MCGIAGMVGKPSRDALEAMLSSTRHRGPDDHGTFFDGPVGLGMNRLAIQDVSSAGHQPMVTDSGRYIMVFNGEVYNFLEEKAVLEQAGYSFRSGTDTEVVLKLYELYGIDCLKRIRGMFAFAIWDKETASLFAVRDHFGIKPLLYAQVGEGLVFCSEIKGLLASGLVESRLDEDAVSEFFLTGHIHQPHSILKSVNMLLPGHYLTWQSGKLDQQKYWDLPATPALKQLPSYEEAAAKVRELMISSVKEEMISDVPLGVFLSGGVDSSVVVAAMREAGAKNIESFSVGFGGDGGAIDETDQAEYAARHFGTSHNKVVVKGAEVLNDFDKIIKSLDQPSIDGYNTYFVSKYTRKKVTVALSGLGGDELFGGYGFHKDFLQRYRNRKSDWFYGLMDFGSSLTSGSEKLYNSLRARADSGDLPGLYSRAYCNFFPPAYKRLITTLKSNRSLSKKLVSNHRDLDAPELADDFQRLSAMNIKGYMIDRLLRDSDTVSMIHSLELRVPVIDIRLAEFVFHLPWQYKLEFVNQNGPKDYTSQRTKKLLVEAFKKELPEKLLTKEKKGFAMPLQHWLQNDFEEKIRHVFLDEAHPVFQSGELNRMYHNWKAGKIHYNQIWSVLVFNEWCLQNKIR